MRVPRDGRVEHRHEVHVVGVAAVPKMQHDVLGQRSDTVNSGGCVDDPNDLDDCRGFEAAGDDDLDVIGRVRHASYRTGTSVLMSSDSPGHWRRQDEAISDVSYRADVRLVLDAELGPQPAYVDVDRPGAAVIVVAPDLLQQLGAREHATGMLSEELE